MIITSPRNALYVRHVLAWQNGRITRGECELLQRLERLKERANA